MGALIKETLAYLTLGIILGTAIGLSAYYVLSRPVESRYLKHPERIGDVVAALLVMSAGPYDSQEPYKWEQAIGACPRSAASWQELFREHPEFFRTNPDKTSTAIAGQEPPCEIPAGYDMEIDSLRRKSATVSLVWRRARARTFDPVKNTEAIPESLASWASVPSHLTRKPLASDETTALIGLAIDMQTQAIARREELRWWVPLVVGLLGVMIGAILKRREGTPSTTAAVSPAMANASDNQAETVGPE